MTQDYMQPAETQDENKCNQECEGCGWDCTGYLCSNCEEREAYPLDDYYQDIADRAREEIRCSERTRIAQGRKWENCID